MFAHMNISSFISYCDLSTRVETSNHWAIRSGTPIPPELLVTSTPSSSVQVLPDPDAPQIHWMFSKYSLSSSKFLLLNS